MNVHGEEVEAVSGSIRIETNRRRDAMDVTAQAMPGRSHVVKDRTCLPDPEGIALNVGALPLAEQAAKASLAEMSR
jgi:hypothetical protein